MAVKFHDYYETLEIGRSATEKEIKAAYRKLARKWHPDLHQASKKEEAEEKFKRINEAYEVLKDPEKRARYDQLGSNWRDGQDFQGAPGMEGFHFYSSGDRGADFDGGFSDFFRSIFGDLGARRSARQAGTVKGEDLEIEINLTIEEAYRGTTRSVRVSGGAVCPECSGTGFRGQGFCPRCGGTGSVAESKTLEVNIPAGVREGGRIRLKGQGGAGLGGGPRGDLYLKVRFLPHPVFRLKDSDLESDMVLRPDQAVMGDRVTVQTLDGPVNVTVPAGSGAGKKLRLRGKGFPNKQKTRGDHYVKVVLDLPGDLSREEEELYGRLHDLRKGRE